MRLNCIFYHGLPVLVWLASWPFLFKIFYYHYYYYYLYLFFFQVGNRHDQLTYDPIPKVRLNMDTQYMNYLQFVTVFMSSRIFVAKEPTKSRGSHNIFLEVLNLNITHMVNTPHMSPSLILPFHLSNLFLLLTY